MRKITGCVVIVLAIVLSGCGAFQLLIPPDEEDIPAPLAFVAGNEGMFTPSGDDPLANVAPGTVIDDLSQLDGCWGLSQPEPSAEIPVELHQAHIFDRESGEYALWSLQKAFFGSVTILSGGTGTFSVDSDNRITVTTTKTFSYSPETRRLEEKEVVGEPPSEWAATLDGDWLRIRFGAANDNEDQREDSFETFRRFDCPE